MKIQYDANGRATLMNNSSCTPLAASAMHARTPSLRARIHAAFGLDQDGQALVEAALILPMLLLLLTGFLIFGVAMNNYMQLTNAVSIGARTLVVNAGVTTDPCNVGATAIKAAAPALGPAYLNFTFTLNGHAYSQSTCSSTSTTSGAAGNLTSGSTVVVTATYPLNLSVYGQVWNLPNAVLSATATEFVQ